MAQNFRLRPIANIQVDGRDGGMGAGFQAVFDGPFGKMLETPSAAKKPVGFSRELDRPPTSTKSSRAILTNTN